MMNERPISDVTMWTLTLFLLFLTIKYCIKTIRNNKVCYHTTLAGMSSSSIKDFDQHPYDSEQCQTKVRSSIQYSDYP